MPWATTAEHLAVDQVGVAIGLFIRLTVEVARHHVGAEKGDRQLHRRQRPGPLQEFELAQFLGNGQAIARLDLQRRHTTGPDPVQGRREPGQQLVVAGVAGSHHARPDAATARRDLGQRCAAQALGVLVVAFAAEQRVAVTLDQAGQHATPSRVDRRHVVIAVGGEHGVCCPNCHDHAVADGHRSIGNDAEVALRRAPARFPAVVNLSQRRGVDDVEVAHWQNSRISCS